MPLVDHRKVVERCISNNTAICAYAEGTLAGGVAFSPSHGGIGFLAVRPEYRRRGLDALLMRHALSRMPSGNTIFLHIHPGETFSPSLYRAQGFREREFIWKERTRLPNLLLGPGTGEENSHPEWRIHPAGRAELLEPVAAEPINLFAKKYV